MIYFWLALVALSFGLTGFFLHAFYFSKREQVEKLQNEMQNMEFRLAMRERGLVHAKEENANAKELVQVLEKGLKQKDGEIETMKNLVQRREEELRLLQMPAPAPPAAEAPKAIPLWKDHLNHVLNVLDRIEKETSKTPGLEDPGKNSK
jgi:hypothetical protein